MNTPSGGRTRDLPLYHTFPEFLDGIAARFGDRPALSWFTRKKEEQSRTYRELTEEVKALRDGLCARGLAEKRVALVGENSADWLTAFFAALSCGCAVVCIDIEQPDDTIRELLRLSDTQVIFLTETFVPICAPLTQEADGPAQLFLMGRGGADTLSGTLPELCGEGRALAACGRSPDLPVVRPEQTAEFVFTSGTTSRPKIVMLSHQSILQNMRDASAVVHLYEKTFTALPFYHAYGLNLAALCSLYQGAQLTINGNLKNAMRDLRLAQPDTMFAVPLLVEAIHNQLWIGAERSGQAPALRKLLKLASVGGKLHLPLAERRLAAVRKEAFGDLHLIICGGAHLGTDILEEFHLLGVSLLQGYGITECAPLISVNSERNNRVGSVGAPMESMEVKLVDGEVWVRGPAVMQGYYKSPEQMREAMEDGWFKTGDLGHRDKDGFLYLTGRKKNLIVFKNGKKLSPEKLEALLLPLPSVKEVMVYGTATGASADDVKLTACVYPDPEQTHGMSSYEILSRLQKEIDQVNARLPAYQQIQMITIRETEFSKTAMQKLKRYDTH